MQDSRGDRTTKRISDLIFDLAPIGIEVYDAEGRLVEANKKCLDLFGVEDIAHVRGFRLFDDPNISPDNLARLREGQPVFYEAVFDFDLVTAHNLYPTSKNGRMYLGVHIAPVTESAHQPPSNYIALVQDITRRKQAEENLRREKELFSLLMDYAPIYVFFKDHNLRALRLSRNFEQMLGRPVEQAVGKTMDQLYPPELAESMIADDRRILETGQTAKVEEELGGRYYETVKFPVPSEDGLSKLAGFTMDISDRKRAEKQLVKITERLALATTAGSLGIWDWNVPTNDMVWDERMFQLYGITSAAFSRTVDAWTSGLHPDDRQRAIDDCNKALAGEKEFDTEFRVVRPSGEVVWIKAHGMVIRDNTGKAVRMLGINSDITARKRVEEELHKAQKLESIGLLAGGIAHDFNNLLHGIFAYIELAKKETQEESTTQYLSRTLAAIDRARALTRQLLTFAKGGAPIRAVASLVPFINETVQFALSGSNLSCRFDIAPDLLPCSYDGSQLGQVVENIVINAQQAMPAGGHIEVAACNVELAEKQHPTLPPGLYVKISITDHGIGISRELLPKIFDPFFTTKPKGQGLGLTTSYSIVNRHGGCIDVDSEPAKGSSFHVYLPATTDARVASPRASAPPHQGNGTFLVMDDEDIVRETLGRMLATFGYEVASTENGSRAVEYVQERIRGGQRVKAMILDLTVPGAMGGEEAIKAIRKIDQVTPVFVASGYAEDPVMANPQAYGFTASICKPFTRSDLARLLNLHMPIR